MQFVVSCQVVNLKHLLRGGEWVFSLGPCLGPLYEVLLSGAHCLLLLRVRLACCRQIPAAAAGFHMELGGCFHLGSALGWPWRHQSCGWSPGEGLRQALLSLVLSKLLLPAVSQAGGFPTASSSESCL